MELTLYKKLHTLTDFLFKMHKTQKSHAYLLISEDTDTLKAASVLFAMHFVCESKSACFKCSACQKVINNTSIDLYTYPKKQSIVVEDVKEIVESVQKKPFDFDKKLYLLNDITTATTAAQNKLLKTLEEPPQDVVFILTASSQSAVLPTIASRAKILLLPRIPKIELQAALQETKKDERKIQIATQLSDGNLGKALQILHSEVYFEVYDFVLDLILNMKSSKDVLNYSSTMEKNRKFLPIYLDVMQTLYRDMILIKSQVENLVFNHSSLNILKTASISYSEMALLKAVERILNAKKMLKFNTNQAAVIDDLLIGLLEVKHKWNQM